MWCVFFIFFICKGNICVIIGLIFLFLINFVIRESLYLLGLVNIWLFLIFFFFDILVCGIFIFFGL